MFKPVNHKLALYVAVLLMLSLFTQVLPLPVVAIVASVPKTESTSPVNVAASNEVALPKPEPAPTVPSISPDAAVINTTLTDNVTAATKIAPGANINYTATITNNGLVVGIDDATNLNFSAPLDANTTLVAGSVHASPIAFNDTYNWVGNTLLDTAARALPAVTANDVAVNAPAGTDTFTVTAIAGGATALGGVVTLASPAGSFVYTPPVGRPNAVDGATVQDSFTYTITNSADGTLTSIGTVKINLTGRVWYLQAGAAGDGRSNTPSGSPSAMSTAADKSTDFFYIFSNAGSLSGLFTVDAGQQLLGQGVALTVNAITLFPAIVSPIPTTTNGAGNCVTLAGAPGNNTLSGFNIGTCSAFGIQGANVGTLAVSTLSINNTTGGGLDLTGVGAPSVNVVLGGLTSTGGAMNVNLVGLNGTVNLAGGALSGASGTALSITGAGSTATVTYSGTISKTSAGRIVDIQNHSTATLITLSGNLTCNTGCTGINASSNTGGTIEFSGGTKTINTGGNQAITLATNTGATINFSNGGLAINATTANGFNATGGGTTSVTTGGTDNTIVTTSGIALNANGVTFGGTGLTFKSISSSGGTNGIKMVSTTGNLTVPGDNSGLANGSGGTMSNITGGVLGNAPVHLLTVSGTIVLKSINMSLNTNCFSGMLVDENAGGTTATVNVTGVTVTGVTASVVQNKSLMQFETGSNAVLTANVQNSYFNSSRTYGVFGGGAGTSTLNMTVNQSGFGTDVNTGAAVNNPGTTITNPPAFGLGVTNGSSALVDYTITNNTFWGASGTLGAVYAVSVSGGTTTAASHLNGSFNGNKIGKSGTVGSGCSPGCSGLGIQPGTLGTYNATILNNDIRQINSDGAIALVNTAGGGASFTSNLHIRGNTLAEPDTTGAPLFLRGIVVSPGNSGGASTTVCAEIGDTTGGGVPANKNNISGAWSNAIRTTILNNTIAMQLPALSPASGASNAQVVTYLTNGNTIGGGAGVASANIGTAGINGGAACPLMLSLDGVTASLFGDTFPWVRRFDSFEFGDTETLAPAANLETNTITYSLNQQQLDSIVVAAIERWSTSGLTAQQLSAMRSIKFEIADLSGAYLGEANGTRIRVDRNAGGFGWFIDPTPLEDTEFGATLASTRRSAYPNGAPTGRLDLLTGVMHELGHDVGLPDTYALLTRDDLMYGYLVRGERRLPRPDEASGAITSGPARRNFLTLSPNDSGVAADKAISLRMGKTSTVPKATTEEIARIYPSEAPLLHHAVRGNFKASSEDQNAPNAGENVTINTIATLPAGGKSITIKYSATVNAPPLAKQVSTQGTVTANGGISVLTDDPEPAGAANPTVTLVDTLMTWNGVTNTDWNTITNWTQPAGGTQYAPGVSNPAINDVVIPNVGNQPNISATDIGIYSLNISNGRTLTISSAPLRILTIGGSPGGNLTLDGIISDGELRLGSGAHTISNAGGTGSLSATNVATVLSGSTVTLNNNLQAGALTVNAGGSMTIATRTLSLNGSGAALTIPGGATFTTTGSTVVFNGTAAQQAPGIAYNNLTINNALGLNVTGVTLTGNASVAGALTLTSSNLDTTGAFTLSVGGGGSSTRTAGHIIGNLKKTFAAPGSFTYHVGTANGYSPVATTVTAGSGDLTVKAVQGPQPLLTPTTSLQRYWTLTEAGSITATMTFTYATDAQDVMGIETNYRVIKVEGGVPSNLLPPQATVNPGTNTFTVTGVTSFSDWTAGEPFAPTAISADLGGRVTYTNGRPMRGITVSLLNVNTSEVILTRTNAKGLYKFSQVVTGADYLITPYREGYEFSPPNRVINHTGLRENVDFGTTLSNPVPNKDDPTQKGEVKEGSNPIPADFVPPAEP